MKDLEKLYNKLNEKYTELEKAEAVFESAICDKVVFNFTVTFCPGDGYCIGNYDSDDVAPLDKCLKIIKEEGKLTYENHKDICI